MNECSPQILESRNVEDLDYLYRFYNAQGSVSRIHRMGNDTSALPRLHRHPDAITQSYGENQMVEQQP